MTDPHATLTPNIIDYCRRCSGAEGNAIVAFCCYMAFRDKSVRRMEVDTVNAIAEQMGISPFETAKMARKARKRRLKIKEPKSKSARALLFHLALRTASADQWIDSRERAAIDKLASQLRIPVDRVEEELQKLQASSRAATSTSKHASIAQRPAGDDHENHAGDETREVFITGLVESIQQDWVVEDLEADLFRHPRQGDAVRVGEVEYTINHQGDAELNVEIDDIDVVPDEMLSVFVAGALVSKIMVPAGRMDETLSTRDGIVIPRVASGAAAEIRYQDATLLTGKFASQ